MRGKRSYVTATTLNDMSTPWFSVVRTLQGSVASTPKEWPVRRVHRMLDDAMPEARGIYLPRIPNRPQSSAPLKARLRCPLMDCAKSRPQTAQARIA